MHMTIYKLLLYWDSFGRQGWMSAPLGECSEASQSVLSLPFPLPKPWTERQQVGSSAVWPLLPPPPQCLPLWFLKCLVTVSKLCKHLTPDHYRHCLISILPCSHHNPQPHTIHCTNMCLLCPCSTCINWWNPSFFLFLLVHVSLSLFVSLCPFTFSPIQYSLQSSCYIKDIHDV